LETDPQSCNLEGKRPEIDLEERLENVFLDFACRQIEPNDIYVTCQLWARGRTITMPVQTTHKSPKNGKFAWNEWLHFPVKIRDLPLEATLLFTMWGARDSRKPHALGGSSLPLFDGTNVLNTGRVKLYIWPNQAANAFSTPYKAPLQTDLDRIESIMGDYERGELPRVDWLDKLSFREIERISEVCLLGSC
jgi:phosphatidylinositol 3-kinase